MDRGWHLSGSPHSPGSAIPGSTLFPTSFPGATQARWDWRQLPLRNAELLI